ncbi:tRNA1(Val) (adenine(37)-N6)-methyltransferase [Asticcacaulis endophyticus]|uniref:Methyltransferase n=1 Tax=Asticcacaulis endophyticus TaxID=1395890 RepID=A0A918US15_9CAUL|nr:methyltransferase [Asticcacaulis endophyticus]GGZ30192.1 methyltransferase [Asticcacaulis endophyticus]
MEDLSPDLPSGVVETTLLNGRVDLWQPAKGYRIGMDGALLAAAAAGVLAEDRVKPVRVLELGCGVGGVMLSLYKRCPQVVATGIERELQSFELLQENIKRNDPAARHTAISGDIGKGFKSFGLERFDMVMSNPPYFDDPTLLRAPHELKRPAWIADDGLSAWTEFAQGSVKDGGEILFVHRADRLFDLLNGLSGRCGSFIIRPIQPFADQPAKRVIVRAKRLGKAPLKLLPPLILHDKGDRKHTPEVEAILRGEAVLKWA